MASDVLITPSSGLIQFSSSAGTGSGQIKIDGDDLVISNALGDVLLGDGASDVFIGDGTNNVDIVFEQNGEIRDDGSGKSIILGSKTTNLFLTGSTSVTLQEKNGNVGIGTTNADALLHISASLANQKYFFIEDTSGTDIFVVTSSGDFGKVGIGTSAPQNPLSVSGSLTVFTNNQVSRLTVGEADTVGESTSNSMIIETAGQNNKSRIFTVGTANDMVVEAVGNKGDVHLSPRRDIRFGINNGTGFNFTERMILTGSTGNLGIGTSTPTKKLEVAGDISASGDIFANEITLTGASAGIKIEADGGTELISTGTAGAFNITSAHDLYLLAASGKQVRIGSNNTNDEIRLNKGHITASGNISASGFVSASSFSGDGAGITNVSATVSGDTFATDLKIGRDSDNHIDFTTDNVMIFDINNASELRLNATSLRPHTNDGLALGSTSTYWSDLYLAEGGFITFDNGDVVLTQTGPLLEMSGSGATRLNVKGEITSSKLSVHALANNVTPFIIRNVDGEKQLDLSIDTNQHSELGIFKDGGEKIKFNSYWPAVIDNDYYETGGGLILGSERSQATSFYGLYVSSGSNSGSAFFAGASSPFIVQGNITASGNISSSGNILTSENITALGTITAEQLTSTDDITAAGTIKSSLSGQAILSLDNTATNGDEWNIISRVRGSTSTLEFRNVDETADAVAITSAGKVGIGTTAPPKELTVQGEISASSTGSFGQLEVAESTLTGSIKPLRGTFNIHYGTDAQFTGSLTAAGGYGEIMSNFNVHTELSKGDICYLIGQTWRKADADGEASTTKMLGVCLEDGNSGGGQPVLIRGVARLRIGHIADAGGDEGDLVYLSTTAGKVQFAAPSTSGQFVRIVGYCLHEANDIIYFDPDKSFVEVA